MEFGTHLLELGLAMEIFACRSGPLIWEAGIKLYYGKHLVDYMWNALEFLSNMPILMDKNWVGVIHNWMYVWGRNGRI
jgi:hypothetical protein